MTTLRLNINLFCLFVTSFFLHGSTLSQWVQSRGPYGGVITCFAAANHSGRYTLFAGTFSTGVYISTDNGFTWSKSAAYPAPDVKTLMVVPRDSAQALLFAGSLSNLFVTTDDGETWSSVFPPNSGVRTLAVNIDASGGTLLFAGTTAQGILVSRDNGTTWSSADSGLPDLNITSLAAHESLLWAATGSQRVFRSSDNGAHWISADSGLSTHTINCLSVAPRGDGGTNLLAGSDAGVFLSTDDGDRWVSVNQGIPIGLNVTALSSVDSFLFAGTHVMKVFRSSMNGLSWTPASEGILSPAVNTFTVVDATVFVGTYAGVFQSSDDGVTWKQTSDGLPNLEVSAVVVPPGPAGESTVYAPTYSTGVFRSTDNGKNWSPRSGGLPNVAVFSLAAPEPCLYAGTTNGVYVTTDAGMNWTNPSSETFTLWINHVGVLDSILFAGTQDGTYESVDRGVTWSPVDSLPHTFSHAYIRLDTTYFVSTSAGLFSSTTGGTSWARIDSGLGAISFGPLAIVPDDAGKPLLFAGTSSGVFRSVNSGASWIPANTNLNNSVTSFAVTPNGSVGSYIYACVPNQGVFMTTDYGENWNSINSGLTSTGTLYSIAATATDLFLASFSGLWRRPLSEVTGVPHYTGTGPHTLVLRQNYPNPFNPLTIISFSIAAKTNVTLNVYDLLGREVSTILDEQLLPGEYSRQWRPDGLASGVYFYRLTAGPYSSTRKLILLR